ncbi:MAG: nitroreductase family protein [Prolixibacteraceae bacterium]|nr:nitroreductase family protein [Prolixibacteraceae bacterium]
MEFKKLITQRFSVRKYKDIPVEEEKILQITDAGRMAPSAVNFQPWHFIVFREPANLEKLYSVYQREWIKNAPVIILACADHNQSWKRNIDGKDSADIDIAIAVDHITLQATELGLGTCWVCNFNVQKCAEIFKLPRHIEPVVMIPLGYPDEEMPAEKKRKPIDKIIHWESF